MKWKLNNRLTLIVGLLILALVLAACGGAPEEPVEEATPETETGEEPVTEEEEAPAEEAEEGEAVALKFLTLDDPDQLLALEEMIDAFCAAIPAD